MKLFPDIKERYSTERLTAREAQREAEFIAWAPVAFQVSRLMIKFGVFGLLGDAPDGLTIEELHGKTVLGRYALKVLLEASLSIGSVLIDPDNDRYLLSKTGWFLLNDPATRANMDFNHDVNYRGLFYLEEALTNGKPEGLKTLGDWPTIYDGLSQLEPQAQKSWFAFDHFYSDHSFDEALKIVFAKHPAHIMDVGGNTGRFALRCVEYDRDVDVTIVDLPGQIGLMLENIRSKEGADRIFGYPANILDEAGTLPDVPWDAIWMSQFLDCFSLEEIYSILCKTKQVMGPDTTLYIMETFWDRQRFETAALCLTMTSVYFTVMANGNSKMYHSDDMESQISRAGLEIIATHDGLGQGHTILEVKLKQQ